MRKRMANRSNRLRVGDIVVVVVVVTASVVSMFAVAQARPGAPGAEAIVEVNGREVHRFVLSDGQPRREIRVEGMNGPSTVVIEDGRAFMLESTCRDKICIGMGRVDSSGQSVVCLPNRVVIRIVGSRKPSSVDSVSE